MVNKKVGVLMSTLKSNLIEEILTPIKRSLGGLPLPELLAAKQLTEKYWSSTDISVTSDTDLRMYNDYYANRMRVVSALKIRGCYTASTKNPRDNHYHLLREDVAEDDTLRTLRGLF